MPLYPHTHVSEFAQEDREREERKIKKSGFLTFVVFAGFVDFSEEEKRLLHFLPAHFFLDLAAVTLRDEPLSTAGRHLPDQLVVDDAERSTAGHEALQDVVSGWNVDGQVRHVLVHPIKSLE